MRILYPAQKAVFQLKKIGLGLALRKTTITEFLPRLNGTDFDFTAGNATRADPDVLPTSYSPTAGVQAANELVLALPFDHRHRSSSGYSRSSRRRSPRRWVGRQAFRFEPLSPPRSS